MKFTKAGIILNTQKYQECVDFYGTILGLDIMFRIDRPKEKITNFALGELRFQIPLKNETISCKLPIKNKHDLK